ncbi:MAG: ferredoxin [candidate division Zixibacteria bacterium HGW-Zixibacteria-1]|nr:MAG: ferredoxin [candidate division Zixibacteria bacterium HGW-Zixibacteria-1]
MPVILVINNSICLQCGGCVPLCPEDALFLTFDHLKYDTDLCTLCGICIRFCPVAAISEEDRIAI